MKTIYCRRIFFVVFPLIIIFSWSISFAEDITITKDDFSGKLEIKNNHGRKVYKVSEDVIVDDEGKQIVDDTGKPTDRIILKSGDEIKTIDNIVTTPPIHLLEKAATWDKLNKWISGDKELNQLIHTNIKFEDRNKADFLKRLKDWLTNKDNKDVLILLITVCDNKTVVNYITDWLYNNNKPTINSDQDELIERIKIWIVSATHPLLAKTREKGKLSITIDKTIELTILSNSYVIFNKISFKKPDGVSNKSVYDIDVSLKNGRICTEMKLIPLDNVTLKIHTNNSIITLNEDYIKSPVEAKPDLSYFLRFGAEYFKDQNITYVINNKGCVKIHPCRYFVDDIDLCDREEITMAGCDEPGAIIPLKNEAEFIGFKNDEILGQTTPMSKQNAYGQ